MSGVSTPLKCDIKNKNYALYNKLTGKRRSLNRALLSDDRVCESLFLLIGKTDSNFLTKQGRRISETVRDGKSDGELTTSQEPSRQLNNCTNLLSAFIHPCCLTTC